MKPGRFNEAMAAVWLGIGVVNGMSTLNASSEAVKAEATATAFAAQGDPQAAEWQRYAKDEEAYRDRLLSLTVLGLGLAAANASIARSRHRRQESQSDPSVRARNSLDL